NVRSRGHVLELAQSARSALTGRARRPGRAGLSGSAGRTGRPGRAGWPGRALGPGWPGRPLGVPRDRHLVVLALRRVVDDANLTVRLALARGDDGRRGQSGDARVRRTGYDQYDDESDSRDTARQPRDAPRLAAHAASFRCLWTAEVMSRSRPR